MSWHAEELAYHLLRGRVGRLRHVTGVGRRAATVAPYVRCNSDDLLAAAWLHDIGYADGVATTGFHALDGARWLKMNRWPDRVVSLVAHHSGAATEAAERGLLAELMVFDRPDERDLDLLIWCDLTTAPDGTNMHVDDRISDILDRYSSTDPVHRAVEQSSKALHDSAGRVELLLADSYPFVGR